jgi:hypothetical protein
VRFVPEITALNWRASAVAKNKEKGLYEHGSENASVINQSHSKGILATIG